MASATFTTTPLMGGGVLVEGTDITGKVGRTILVSDKWDMSRHVLAHKQASEVFDAAVNEVFAPIVAAAEEARELLASPANKFSKIVISEGNEFDPSEVIDLDMDGILLNILEQGHTDLLRWIGDDTLVAVLA